MDNIEALISNIAAKSKEREQLLEEERALDSKMFDLTSLIDDLASQMKNIEQSIAEDEADLLALIKGGEY